MSLSPAPASTTAALNGGGSSNNSSRSTTTSPPATGEVLIGQYPAMASLPSPPLLTPDQATGSVFGVEQSVIHPHVPSGVAEIDPFATHSHTMAALENAMIQDPMEMSASAATAAFQSTSPASLAGTRYIPFDPSASSALEQSAGLEIPSSRSLPSAPLPLSAQSSTPPLSAAHPSSTSFGVNVSTPSSLQSALDPAVAVSLASNGSSLAAQNLAIGLSGGATAVSFHPNPDPEHKLEVSMLEEIVKSASTAMSLCRWGKGAEANIIIGELHEKLSLVSDVISGISGLTVGENGLASHTLSQAATAFTSGPEFFTPLAPIPETSQLVFASVPNSDIELPSVPVQAPLSTALPSTSVPIPVSMQNLVAPGPEVSARKRCASEVGTERPIKALKAEPLDELLYNGPALPPSHSTLQSPPPSRPPTPGTAQSTPFVFNPVKSPPTSFPPSSSASPASIPSPQSFAFNPAAVSSPDLLTGTPPVFPPLRSAWSESVVPTIGGQSRHNHSLSTGSISTSPGTLTGANSPVSHTSAVGTSKVHPSPPRFTTGVNARVNGRMIRSGSIGALGTAPFTYTYPKQSSQWPTEPPPMGYLGNGTATTTTSAAKPIVAKEPVEEGYDDEDEDTDSNNQGIHPTSDVPQEYRTEVDRVFFEFLNKICSNLDATDSKGDPIHQPLMAKKMQRLDESTDFRPFKFRIQAFTNAFLAELAGQGYPEEKIPMKKIRNYLWHHPYIQRYNEDGKKSKSKGNYIWNVEARRPSSSNVHWDFRPFQRKIAGAPPAIAYSGIKWSWTPHIWDPQASFANVLVYYSSPNLPSWLKWNGDELSGTPPAGTESCDIRVDAKFILDGQEGHLSTSFHLTIAPRSAVETGYTLPRSQSDTMLHQLPTRAAANRIATNSRLHPTQMRSHHTPLATSMLPPPPAALPPQAIASPPEQVDDTPARVVEVLQQVAQRVIEQAVTTHQIQTQIHAEPITPTEHANANAVADHLENLVKQKEAVEQSIVAYDRALTGPTPRDTHKLAVTVQEVVSQAAQNAMPDAPSGLVAIQTASVGDMTSGVQEALAVAVQAMKVQGTGEASNLEVIEVTRDLLAATKNTLAPGGPMHGVVQTGTAVQVFAAQVVPSNASNTNAMETSAPMSYTQSYPISGYV